MEIVGMHLLPPRFALFFCRVAKMDKTVKGALIRSTKGETQRGSDSSLRGEILKMYLLKNNFKNIPVPIFF
jgi:hypothetical protein